jgi:hypothetical protein
MHMRIYKQMAFRHYLHALSISVRKLLELSLLEAVIIIAIPFSQGDPLTNARQIVSSDYDGSGGQNWFHHHVLRHI